MMTDAIHKRKSEVRLLISLTIALLMFFATSASADTAAAKKWIDSEFQPSTLSKAEQMKEP